ncbi:alpha/beta fold hydrolase [Methylomarinum sp. Ch1-1]|uniref:Alpha/beta fold hydrolase n=1 Tax=Methylomarinum roseum TaxID=3067653 RepID=A0AAU7NT66_9GAMM|nr:alpha/beta fold hydrolase [Methylomarinum sp. Ch1-1]MDP4520144.1 alpha/beta fold hydrolase [Methylomarinum sp. Ch1-1]
MKPLPLAFDEFGDPAARPLVILHGFFASSRNWRTIAKKLAVRHHVYVLDMRNHGASPHSPQMDYPVMATDLKYFLDQQGVERVNLLGHSMGGKAAMWFALNCPDSVDKLIVADISPTRYRHSFDQTIQALQNLPLHAINNRKEADEILAETIGDSSYRQFLLQNLQLEAGEYRWRVDLDIFYRTADNIIGFPDVEGVTPYSEKTLFLGGEHSDYIRREDVRRLFPAARIKTIPDAAHWLHVQAPELFCDEVDSFLA